MDEDFDVLYTLKYTYIP